MVKTNTKSLKIGDVFSYEKENVPFSHYIVVSQDGTNEWECRRPYAYMVNNIFHSGNEIYYVPISDSHNVYLTTT